MTDEPHCQRCGCDPCDCSSYGKEDPPATPGLVPTREAVEAGVKYWWRSDTVSGERYAAMVVSDRGVLVWYWLEEEDAVVDDGYWQGPCLTEAQARERFSPKTVEDAVGVHTTVAGLAKLEAAARQQERERIAAALRAEADRMRQSAARFSDTAWERDDNARADALTHAAAIALRGGEP